MKTLMEEPIPETGLAEMDYFLQFKDAETFADGYGPEVHLDHFELAQPCPSDPERASVLLQESMLRYLHSTLQPYDSNAKVIYEESMEHFDPKLFCVVFLPREALARCFLLFIQEELILYLTLEEFSWRHSGTQPNYDADQLKKSLLDYYYNSPSIGCPKETCDCE